MKKTMSIFAAAVITLSGMASTAGALPLTAMPVIPAPASASSEGPQATPVQYRNGYRQGYRNGYRNGYRPRGYGPGPGYYRQRNNNTGAAVAAGVIGGLALGAAAAAAANSNAGPPRGGNDWIAYCSQRYRSFDPASGTYLGYDGRRHACQ